MAKSDSFEDSNICHLKLIFCDSPPSRVTNKNLKVFILILSVNRLPCKSTRNFRSWKICKYCWLQLFKCLGRSTWLLHLENYVNLVDSYSNFESFWEETNKKTLKFLGGRERFVTFPRPFCLPIPRTLLQKSPRARIKVSISLDHILKTLNLFKFFSQILKWEFQSMIFLAPMSP